MSFQVVNISSLAILITVFCSILLNNKIIAGYQMDTHNVAKRMDLESCIGQFDVQRDMIIRTEESRSMGAKFLDHADVGSREECLRLCCETKDCDVFVFEEKNLGTCFIFQCGPSQNFRCKFTHHLNYTSAVLTPMKKVEPPPQMLPPPPPLPQVQQQVPAIIAPPLQPFPNQPQISFSQHEMELSNLKDKTAKGDPITTLMPPLGVRIADLTTATTTTNSAYLINAPAAASSHCSRFQFQCHSGECIAVYNACDGIPQCIDESDEGPECPSNAVTMKPQQQLVMPAAGIADPRNSQINMQRNGIVQIQKTPVSSQNIMLPSASIQRQYSAMQQHNREDPMTSPQLWPPRSNNNNDGPPQQYSEHSASDSHIFNHKGGLQLPSTNNNNINMAQQYISNNGYVMPQQRPDSYMQPMQDNYRIAQWMPDTRISPQWPQQSLSSSDMQMPIQQQQQQQQQQDLIDAQQRPDWPVRPILPVVYPQNNVVTINKAQTVEDEKSENSENIDLSAKNKENKEMSDSSAAANDSVGDSEDSSEYEEEEKQIVTTPPPPVLKKKQRKHKKQDNKSIKKQLRHDEHDKPTHEQLKIIKSELDIEFMDHDGAADIPGGAVLSLTLGIIITAALAILIGCRATVVRRRARRGGKSTYAHDADFLVNGMYL